MHKLVEMPDFVLAETLVEILREAGIAAHCPAGRTRREGHRSGTAGVYLERPADEPTAKLILAEFNREVANLASEMGLMAGIEGVDEPAGPGRHRRSA